MKIFKLVNIIILLMITSVVSSQNKDLLNQYEVLKGKAIIRNDAQISADIDGSPFYKDNKEFVPGKLYIPNYDPLFVNIRYNIATEEMQVLMEKDRFQVLKQEVKLTIDNTLFQKYRYINEEGNHYLGYFKVISESEGKPKLILLEKLLKEVRGSERNKRRGIDPKMVDKSDFYLKFDNSFEAVYADSRTKNFMKIFPPEERDAIETFIDDKKLKPRKKEDLESIVEYYNTNFN